MNKVFDFVNAGNGNKISIIIYFCTLIFFCITVDLNVMIEEKNPLHREYGLFSNINYVLQGMRKYSKILMWMLPIGFVISPIQRYLWSFITKFVIDIVTNNSGVKNLLFVAIKVTYRVNQIQQKLFPLYFNSF